MSSKKIAAIVLVMGIGVLISFFIINGSSPVSSQNISASLAPSDKSSQISLPQNPIKWVENLISGNSSKTSDSQQNTQATDINSTNLTDLVGQSMFSNMQSLDQSGQNPFQNLDPNSADSQKMLQQAVDSVQNPTALFTSTVNDQDLKISNDNSKQAKINYLNSINNITKEMFSDPKYIRSADELVKSFNQDCLASDGTSLNGELAGLYQKAADDYLSLTVPYDWLDVHKRIIIHFKEAQLIFGAVSGCIADPIKGQLAIKALPDFMKESGEIQINLNRKIRELSL